MFSCAVGCQPDVPAAVVAYCTYMGRVVFNTLGSVADWITWLGFEEAACVHQCYIDLFCQVIVGEVCKCWAGAINLCKCEFKMEPRTCFGLDRWLDASS